MRTATRLLTVLAVAMSLLVGVVPGASAHTDRDEPSEGLSMELAPVAPPQSERQNPQDGTVPQEHRPDPLANWEPPQELLDRAGAADGETLTLEPGDYDLPQLPGVTYWTRFACRYAVRNQLGQVCITAVVGKARGDLWTVKVSRMTYTWDPTDSVCYYATQMRVRYPNGRADQSRLYSPTCSWRGGYPAHHWWSWVPKGTVVGGWFWQRRSHWSNSTHDGSVTVRVK